MEQQKCPKCERMVYQLYKQDSEVGCAYCLKNLWAINEERRFREQERKLNRLSK